MTAASNVSAAWKQRTQVAMPKAIAMETTERTKCPFEGIRVVGFLAMFPPMTPLLHLEVVCCHGPSRSSNPAETSLVLSHRSSTFPHLRRWSLGSFVSMQQMRGFFLRPPIVHVASAMAPNPPTAFPGIPNSPLPNNVNCLATACR